MISIFLRHFYVFLLNFIDCCFCCIRVGKQPSNPLVISSLLSLFLYTATAVNHSLTLLWIPSLLDLHQRYSTSLLSCLSYYWPYCTFPHAYFSQTLSYNFIEFCMCHLFAAVQLCFHQTLCSTTPCLQILSYTDHRCRIPLWSSHCDHSELPGGEE